MARVKQITENGTLIYPQTVVPAVVDLTTGASLSTTINEIKQSISSVAKQANRRLDDLDVPYEDEYLTFQLEETTNDENYLFFINLGLDVPMTIYVSTDKIYWKLVTASDGYDANSESIGVLSNKNDKIYIKGSGVCAQDATELYHYFRINGTGSIKISGNLASLVDGDLFKFHNKVNNKFCKLFTNIDQLTDASNLIISDIEQSAYAFDGMFAGCSNLTQGPDILEEVITQYVVYKNMFNECSSLKYIKCLSKVIDSDVFLNWVEDVPEGGTFIINDNINRYEVGDSGIPAGWKIVLESEYNQVDNYELNTMKLNIQDLYSRVTYLNQLVLALASQTTILYSGTVSPQANAVLIECDNVGSDGGKLIESTQTFNVQLVGFVSNGVNTYNIDFANDITYNFANAHIYNRSNVYSGDNNINAINSALNITADSNTNMPVVTFIPNSATAAYKLRHDCELRIPMTYSANSVTLSLEVKIPLYLVAQGS